MRRSWVSNLRRLLSTAATLFGAGGLASLYLGLCERNRVFVRVINRILFKLIFIDFQLRAHSHGANVSFAEFSIR